MSTSQDLTGVMLDGRYRLTRLMGQGGMGQVYEGIHEFLDRRVAVKVLLPRLACEAKFRERFLREAKAASKILHRNVVKILDFGQTPHDSVYFVMEMLEGHDLKALLRQTGPLPWPRARHMLLQILAALEAAHRQRIIHRDIKPANCFVVATRDDQEWIKLLDFGIAKVTADPEDHTNSLAESLTGTGEVFGSVKYMAPEQATGFSDDPRVDLYSVGILAYEMLTGQVPFSGPFAFHVVSKHLNEPPRPPRTLNPAIPPAVEAVILQALAKHPDHRFASARHMRRALEAIAETADGSTLVVTPQPADSATGRTDAAGHTVRTPGTWPATASGSAVTHRPIVSASGGLPRATRRRSVPVILVVVLLVMMGCAGLLVLAWQHASSRPDVEVEHSAKARDEGRVADPAALGATTGAPQGMQGELDPPPASTGPPGTTTGTLEADSGQGSTSSEGSGGSQTTPPASGSSRGSGNKRLTDARARARLRRAIETRCRSLGASARVTVDVVVGSDGRALDKIVKGASGRLQQCVIAEIGKAKFPKGTTRRVTVHASP